jgi:hypothetical protein
LESTVIASARIPVNLARLLRSVLKEEVDIGWEQRTSSADRPLLAQLLRLGWVERNGTRYRLTAQTAESLALPVAEPKRTRQSATQREARSHNQQSAHLRFAVESAA